MDMGLNPKAIKWLYLMIVRPLLTYGCHVWWEKVTQNTVINKLNHLQRMVCLAITGAMHTTPTAAMESLLGFLPLHIQIESVAKSELYRLPITNQATINCYNEGHTKIWRNMVIKYPILSATSDFEPIYPFTDLNFNVRFPDREEWTELNSLPIEGDITFYTDGSLKDDRSGAGIYCPSPEFRLSVSLGRYVSVSSGDTAISLFPTHCLKENYCGKSIDICSDSLALRALSSIQFKSKQVLECR